MATRNKIESVFLDFEHGPLQAPHFSDMLIKIWKFFSDLSEEEKEYCRKKIQLYGVEDERFTANCKFRYLQKILELNHLDNGEIYLVLSLLEAIYCITNMEIEKSDGKNLDLGILLFNNWLVKQNEGIKSFVQKQADCPDRNLKFLNLQ